MSTTKQGGISMAYPLQGIGYTKLRPSEAAGIKLSVNNLNVTLKFAEKPNSEIQDNALRLLVSSYKSRIAIQ